MFIHLDDSLLVEKNDPIYNDVVRAVRNLAIAAFESKHILYGDFNVIVAMRKHFKYEPDLLAIFNQIYQLYSRMACPMEISYYIKVTKEDGPEGVDEEGKRYGQVSYKFFEDTNSTQICNLISEDFNDCKFYRLVLDHYKKLNKINITCKFHNVSGSGDRTVDNILNCVYTNKQISLCIVDSDKKYKEQTIPSNKTAGKCMRIGKNIPTYVLLVLNVHEIENLVPFNVIDHMTWYDENRGNKEAFDHLRHNAKSEYVLPYFDIKNGIEYDELLRTDATYKYFVMVCYYLLPELAAHGNYENYLAGLKDGELIYPHLIKNLLKNYLEYVKENPLFDVELMEFQEEEWKRISRTMLNMGCSRKVEAVV